MNDFDLVPASYRQRLARKRLARIGIAATAALVVVAGAASLAVGYWIDSLRNEIAELERQQAISTQQRNTIASLNKEKAALEQQWRLLEGLRSGMPAKAMMESVQSALTEEGEVWFDDWRLRRAGIVTERETAPNQPGYFIIIKRQGNAEDWRSQTHMTIKGKAWDHSKLSEFAQRLLQQPNVRDVHVQRTQQGYGRGRQPTAVDFDLAIVFGEREEPG